MWTVPTNASHAETACCQVLRVDRVCDGALAEKSLNYVITDLEKASGRRRALDVPVRGGPRRPLARIAHSRIALKSVARSDGSSQGRKAH